MDAKALLKDPMVVPSVAWTALKRLFGEEVTTWEPDTIRLELRRRGVPPPDGLMSKLLAAQTITNTRVWTYDHEALFAFAVACDGVTASAEALVCPTPEQLCWAMREIQVLTGLDANDDEGFDPDAIDPAIGLVLHEEGFAIAPDGLGFCDNALSLLNMGDAGLRDKVRTAWADLATKPIDSLRSEVAGLPENAVSIQLQRLADCRLYVAEAEERRARQNAVAVS